MDNKLRFLQLCLTVLTFAAAVSHAAPSLPEDLQYIEQAEMLDTDELSLSEEPLDPDDPQVQANLEKIRTRLRYIFEVSQQNLERQ